MDDLENPENQPISPTKPKVRESAESRRRRAARKKAEAEARKLQQELERQATTEEILRELRDFQERATRGERPTMAELKAIELKGKTAGVFVDVQKVEIAEKEPAAFLAELDEVLLNDSEFRNHIRRRLAEIDGRGAGESDPLGGEDSPLGLLRPPQPSILFPGGHRH